MSGASERRVVLAAGGTGGHMFPAQALAAEMRARGWAPALITDARGLKLAEDFPADPIETVDAATLSPRKPIQAIKGVGRLAGGVRAAGRLIRTLKPEAVVGFGGYPSAPALAAAGGAPIILHEQNAVLGRANRLFAGRAAALASGFNRLERMPKSAAKRWRITGNPVRAGVLAKRAAPYAPPEPGAPIHVLILGGSLGARILSEITPLAIAALPELLRRRLRVTQQAREDWLDQARDAYAEAGVEADCRPFFDDVAERLARSHLVIARAGASTVTEIAVVGRPAVLVPLGIAMDDHQTLNAATLAEAGAADVLTEADFTGARVSGLLNTRLSAPADLARRAAAARAAGRPDATTTLADLVEAVAAKRR